MTDEDFHYNDCGIAGGFPHPASAHKPDYNKMEKKEAKKDGAKLVRNSGRGSEKGDAKLDEFLVDYKFNAKSFSLSLANWHKHRKDAWGNGKREPLISIIFGDGTKVAIIDWELFTQLRESIAVSRDEYEELVEKAWMYDDLCK